MGYLDSAGLEKQIQYIKEFVRRHSAGFPLGYEYFTINPNIPQGSLPLFGGEYSRDTYADLWAWVQEQTGYLKTEADWMDLATANNGNVPFYSDGDGSTTFRVPSLKCWIKGANGTVTEVGSYLEAGLPNITGSFGLRKFSSGSPSVYDFSGAIYKGSDIVDGSNTLSSNGTVYNLDNISINASRSSSIYGNSATVQPESIVGMWLVKAYGTIEDTGTIDEQQYIDDRIAALPNTFLPLAGGTMIGNIIFGNNAFIQNQSADILGYNQFEIGCGEPETQSGTEWGAGGAKMAFHSYHADNPTKDDGSFHILASNGTNNRDFNGKPDGTLKWDGKEVERVNAKGTKYIRYEDGLQICWGEMSVTGGNAHSSATCTLPVSFGNTSYIITVGGAWVASTSEYFRIESKATTKFIYSIVTPSSNNHAWYWCAVGWWK